MPLALDACTNLLSSLEEEEQLTMKLLELQGAMEMLQTASVSQKYTPAPVTIDLDASGNEVQMEVQYGQRNKTATMIFNHKPIICHVRGEQQHKHQLSIQANKNLTFYKNTLARTSKFGTQIQERLAGEVVDVTCAQVRRDERFGIETDLKHGALAGLTSQQHLAGIFLALFYWVVFFLVTSII